MGMVNSNSTVPMGMWDLADDSGSTGSWWAAENSGSIRPYREDVGAVPLVLRRVAQPDDPPQKQQPKIPAERERRKFRL